MSDGPFPELRTDEVAGWFKAADKLALMRKWLEAKVVTASCSNQPVAQEAWANLCRVLPEFKDDLRSLCDLLEDHIKLMNQVQQSPSTAERLQATLNDVQKSVKDICTKQERQVQALEQAQERQEQALNSVIGLLSLEQPTPPSASAYGSDLLEKLGDRIKDFVPCDGDPIFSDDLLDNLRDKRELDFVAICFSRLQDLLGNHRLISSEFLPWHPTGSSPRHDQKPDLLVLHPAFYTQRKPSKERTILCGVPSSSIFYNELKSIDFKLTDPNANFGECVIHLNHLYDCISKKSGKSIITRGAAADQTGIRLVECLMRAPISVLYVKWSDKGGAKAFTDFFTSSCKKPEETIGYILDEICKELEVSIVESTLESTEEPCFLGAGAMGKVFKVQDSSKNQYALKMVLGETDTVLLKREHMILKEICSVVGDAQPITVTSVKYCEVKVNEIIAGAGFLMTPVGKPLNKKNADHFKLGLNSLLKLHSILRYHGDARAANMILWEGQVRLCDLRDCRPFVMGNYTDYQLDIKAFLQSFDILFDSDFQELLKRYDPCKEDAAEILTSISVKVKDMIRSCGHTKGTSKSDGSQ
eukprot:CAMPEP_0172158456 /NCGR_PEP_ID=MMETSP1050-20130122/4383_1 /TAXON_ID=233186 /ORGANISM="Cryptomonas curvata, Strain CCAP979/52" /LENGTH=585 /DNA_ID=CAMNT_0012827851 /DNA_START=187 /DNA_END=1944 /DNA_ORIENTATION=+